VEVRNWYIYSSQYLTINDLLNSLAWVFPNILMERVFHRFRFLQAVSSTRKGFLEPSHKCAAVKAGLGEIGISGLLITSEFGSRLQLASTITDVRLTTDKKVEKRFFDCIKCLKCVIACPIKAIGENGSFDKYSCKERHENLKKAGLRCPLCIKVCPVRR